LGVVDRIPDVRESDLAEPFEGVCETSVHRYTHVVGYPNSWESYQTEMNPQRRRKKITVCKVGGRPPPHFRKARYETKLETDHMAIQG